MCRCFRSVKRSSNRGIFVFERESLVMRKWQILEFDGKPYYAFIPEDDTPIREEAIPELTDEVSIIEDHQSVEDYEDDDDDVVYDNEGDPEDYVEYNEDSRNPKKLSPARKRKSSQDLEGEQIMIVEDSEIQILDDEPESPDVKPTIVNGKVQDQPPIKKTTRDSKTREIQNPFGDLYQVKLESGMVVLEKVNAIVETVEGGQKSYTKQEKRVSKILPHMDEDEDDDEVVVDLEGYVNPANEDEPVQVDLMEMELEGLEDEDEDDAEATASLAAAEEIEKNSGLSLKCKACSETFDTSLAFRKHVAWTHKKKVCIQENGIFICSVCDYRTKKKPLFAAHLQRKHDTWARGKRQSSSNFFPCSTCGFVCRSKHSLQSHFIRKHTDRYEHTCSQCGKVYKVKGDLTNHIRFHHKEKPVKCDICEKVCQNSGSLYVHQKWSHFKPKFECKICHRRMVTQENLDNHILKQHEQREKIFCQVCQKSFAKRDSWKRHMSVHTGEKPYECVICQKPFARRSQLRQHLLIHTGKRPFVCDLCGKAFTQKPGLISHRKTHPGPHPPLPVMPIGELVKEFTEEFLAGKNQRKDKEIVEQLERLQEEEEEDGPEEEEEEEEEYEEVIEEAVVECDQK